MRRSRRATDAIAWYGLALAVFVPAIWLLVVTDWNNEALAEIGCWVVDPIAILFVPSVLFAVYLLIRSSLALGVYILLSMAEIILLVPTWFVLWYCVLL